MNNRKGSRVQGGWADLTPSNSKTTAQAPNTKHFIYQDPSKITMPGQRPSNFSWIVDGVLAGSSFPHHPTHFQYYLNQGIRHIITLTDFKPPMHCAPPGLSNLFMPVREFEAPSLDQIKRFVDFTDDARNKKEAVVVHCHWGRGRTGTMLAAYLVKDQDKHPQDAIDEIRRRRPYSVETCEQEDSVFEYYEHLKSQRPKAEDAQHLKSQRPKVEDPQDPH